MTLVSVAVGYEVVSNCDEVVGVGERDMGSGWLHLLVVLLFVVLIATLYRYSALYGFCLESISCWVKLLRCLGANRCSGGLGSTALDGPVTGFVGANGAGKSTALKILAGTLSADGGSAWIDGEPYWESTIPEKRAGFFLGADRLPGAMMISMLCFNTPSAQVICG